MNRTPRVLALASLLLLACGGSETPPPATTPAPTASAAPAPTTPPPAPSAAADAGAAEAAPAPKLEATAPTVKLLEPGATPRRKLRNVYKAGVSERAQMDMKMSMSAKTEQGESPRMQVPSVRTIMRLDAKEVTPEGDLRYAFEAERIEVLKDLPVDPKLRGQLESEMQKMVGMHGKGRMSPRGLTSEVELDLPPQLSPALRANLETLRDSLKDLAMPLPEEEVGVGAKWEVTARTPMAGAMTDIRSVYTLKKLTNDSMTTDIEVTLSAPPNQPMALPNLPPGATATLDSMQGTGKGTATRAFAKLVGQATSHIASDTTMKIKPAPDAPEQKLGMKTEVDLTIKPTNAAPPAPAKKK